MFVRTDMRNIKLVYSLFPSILMVLGALLGEPLLAIANLQINKKNWLDSITSMKNTILHTYGHWSQFRGFLNFQLPFLCEIAVYRGYYNTSVKSKTQSHTPPNLYHKIQLIWGIRNMPCSKKLVE